MQFLGKDLTRRAMFQTMVQLGYEIPYHARPLGASSPSWARNSLAFNALPSEDTKTTHPAQPSHGPRK